MCALFILHFIALPAVIHLVRLSEGKELPRFQYFRSTKTSNKFLNAWGKKDSLSQIYQGTSVQVLIAFNGLVFLLVKL